jgi:transposase
MTLATVVDWLTRSQLRRHLGALPVLYALLEILQVQALINRYCRTKAEIDHGTVAVVLILNRLMAPRPLYKVADWVATTVLSQQLGIPAGKFNDDRLGRTLDALAEHKREIWQEVVHQALVRFDLDLRFLFYDLTAFVMSGAYPESEWADYGFAHNTPSGKKKLKVGVTATADGKVPLEYQEWSGRTADRATVQQNMERLCGLLERHGWPAEEVLLMGDCAMLNDELAVAYDQHEVKYVALLQPQRKEHRELLTQWTEGSFQALPLTAEKGPQGYWGRPCRVVFEHEQKRVVHHGLVVVSGPMRAARRQGRAKKLRALRKELEEVRGKIGRPRYRTAKEVQARAETRLRNSPVGKLMRVEASGRKGAVRLRWWVDRIRLREAMRRDGRYLLVTNAALSPSRMLELYRSKNGLDQRFRVGKQDLAVRPIFLHQDARIEAMLLVNMMALLAYSLLERQAQQGGLQLTTRRIIEQLENVDVIETECWDGSVLQRLTPVDEEQARLLVTLGRLLQELQGRGWPGLEASPVRRIGSAEPRGLLPGPAP